MTQSKHYEAVLKSLERQFPGRTLLSVAEYASALGYSPKSIYNQLSTPGSTDVRPVKIRNRPRFRITDVAAYLANLKAA